MDVKQYPANLEITQVQLFRSLQSYAESVQQHEDVISQTLALSVLPDDIKAKHSTFEEALRLFRQSGGNGDASQRTAVEQEDALLGALLNWYKKDFFSWMNSPSCSACGGGTKAVAESLQPNIEEMSNGAHRVESYICEKTDCRQKERFPRYNNPKRLLETRTGRCGEWANCFLLFTRALGFQSRFIWDKTDHVWVEIYSVPRSRWIHLDPCEAAMDKPLLYETGWGKNLTYVIALACDHNADVTWRYAAKHSDTLARRTLCYERSLIDFLQRQNRNLQSRLPLDRRKELLRYHLFEQAEFLLPRSFIKDGEGIGRQSGSLSWRESRGETGTSPDTSITPRHVISLPNDCDDCSTLLLKYAPSTDEYSITCLWNNASPPRTTNTQRWSSLAFDAENIARKEELDWKQVYLARIEGSEPALPGSITWKFDFSSSNQKHQRCIEKCYIRFATKCFENGRIRLSVCTTDDVCHPIQTSSCDTEAADVSHMVDGSSGFTLSAHLSGGSGPNAWQHAQMFRGPTTRTGTDAETKLFTVRIEFKDES